MSNPLYNALGAQSNNSILAKFNEFKQNFRGDAKAEVMKLLQTGQMSQAQFNQFQAMAQQFQNFAK